MERRLTEEQITKSIIRWLTAFEWEIVCYDFPQSGTGYVIHSSSPDRGKNKGAIIPDIVAIKDGVCVFFENKDRFVLADFFKINGLILENEYQDGIAKLLSRYQVDRIFYGVGLPFTTTTSQKMEQHRDLIDFVLQVDLDKAVLVTYQNYPIFST